jgi:hypothetical protein
MLHGFRQLSETFFSDILSRKHKQAVRVRRVRMTDCPAGREDAAPPQGLKRVSLETSIGPVRLIVKELSPPRDREARMWRFLQGQGGLPLPEVYYVDHDQRLGRYGVILEYIDPPAQAEPWDVPRCRLVGTAMAAFHALFWDKTGELPDAFMVPETAPRARFEPAARRFLDRMDEEQHAVLHGVAPGVFGFLVKLLGMPPRFFQDTDDPPKTLIHGALDASEVLFRRRGDAVQPVLIDWEHARVGQCTQDLAPLICGLSRQDRPATGEALLGAYLDALIASGIAFRAAQLRREVDRQRVLLAGRELVRHCSMYLDRRNEQRYEHWCKCFTEMVADNAAEMKATLERLS